MNKNIIFIKFQTGEEAQRLRAHTAFVNKESSIPNMLLEWPMSSCNCSSRESIALFMYYQALCSHGPIHTYTHTHILIILKELKIKCYVDVLTRFITQSESQ